MNVKVLSSLVCGLMLTLFLTVPVRAADADDDDMKVRTEEQRIDKEASTAPQKIDALAKQFNVPASTVQDLRNKGQGWGEITIGLSMAQQLAKTDPKTFPTSSDALN